MKVILLQNTMYNGERVLAGQELDLQDDVAKNFIKAKLAKAQKQPEPQKQPENPEAEGQGTAGKKDK